MRAEVLEGAGRKATINRTTLGLLYVMPMRMARLSLGSTSHISRSTWCAAKLRRARHPRR